jgi:hypothetical protein
MFQNIFQLLKVLSTVSGEIFFLKISQNSFFENVHFWREP